MCAVTHPFLRGFSGFRSVFLIGGGVLAFLSSAVAGTVPVFDEVTLRALLAGTPEGEIIKAGDMLFRRDALAAQKTRLERGRQTRSAVPTDVALWPNGRVPVMFDSSVSISQRRTFEEACAKWAEVASVNFVPATANDLDYIIVYTTDENSSYVGVQGGPQPLNMVSWGSLYIVCHELGHALGLMHEQCRSDRDTYVTVLTQNILPGKQHNFDKINTTNKTAYDFASVMHYPRDAFSANGSDTLVPTGPYLDKINIMGQRNELSALDKQTMASLYSGSPGKAPVLSYLGYKVHDGDTPGSIGNADGLVNVGETVELAFRLQNDSLGVLTYLRVRTNASASPTVKINSTLGVSKNIPMEPGEKGEVALRLALDPSGRANPAFQLTAEFETSWGNFSERVSVPIYAAIRPAKPLAVRVVKKRASGGTLSCLLEFQGSANGTANFAVECRTRGLTGGWSSWKSATTLVAAEAGKTTYQVSVRAKRSIRHQFRVVANGTGASANSISKSVSVRLKERK